MRLTVIAATLALCATPAFAGDPKPSAIGHLSADGKMWRVEGCAAYPVQTRSKPVVSTLKMTRKPAATPGKLAKNKKN